jgi:hypothetical protein
MTSQNVQQETCWAPIMLLIRILSRELGDGELGVRISRPESAFVRRRYKKVQKGTRCSIPKQFPPTEQSGRDWNSSYAIPSSISHHTACIAVSTSSRKTKATTAFCAARFVGATAWVHARHLYDRTAWAVLSLFSS